MNGLRRLKRFATLVLLVVMLLSVGLSSAAAAPGSGEPAAELVAGEILVAFQPGTPGQAMAELHRQNGGAVQETIAGIGVQVVRVPAGQEKERAARYQRNPNVLFAEVNGLYHAFFTPDDTNFGQQWQYNNANDADIDAVEAWNVTLGDPGVAIAILDTGIDQSHPDLVGKVTKNVNFSTSRTVDDKYGHGTHVAGSAAAVTSNGIGVAGTCPKCTLYNVKVLNDSGSGSWSGIAKGIRWAADNGAKVISMSLGGSIGSSTLKSAVDYAWGKKVVVVAAAGNDGWSLPSYPAYYANAIAVAATDSSDLKASWSNYGKSWVDVAAPGVSILSTAPDHTNTIWGSTGAQYGTISGTSMATPHVAGLAGLVWSSGLCTTNTCVRAQIEKGADQKTGTGTGTGRGTYWAWGRINAFRSVSGLIP